MLATLVERDPKGATPFPGFTLDPYLKKLIDKQGGIKYHFLSRLGIAPRSLRPLANTLLI